MSEDSHLLEPKEKKKRTPYEWFMLLLRICFFICAFALVVITVLANMGGSGEKWHEGVRGFISEFAGGRPANLRTLNSINFFPNVSIDIEGVEILAKPDDVVPLIKVEELRIGMPFLDVATRSPRIREFYVAGLSTIKGVFMPAEFVLNKIYIDHDQVSPQATLRADGKIGLQSWSMEAGLDVEKSIFGKNTYVLASKSSFAVDFADVHLSGTYNHVSSRHLKIEGFELRAGEKVVSGDIVISTVSKKLMKLQGTLNIQNGRTVISPDIIIDSSNKDGAPTHVSGEITSDKLVLDDVIGKQSVFGIFARIRELMGYTGELSRLDGAPSYFGKHDLNVHVFLQNVEADNAAYEALSFDLLKEVGRMRISEVIGKDERQLMPPLILLQKADNKFLTFIMQEGTLDNGLLRPWLDNLPDEVSCAVGELQENESSWKLALSDKNIELPKEQYDFVQASLHKAGKGSPCSPYISLQEPNQEEPKQEAPEE